MTPRYARQFHLSNKLRVGGRLEEWNGDWEEGDSEYSWLELLKSTRGGGMQIGGVSEGGLAGDQEDGDVVFISSSPSPSAPSNKGASPPSKTTIQSSVPPPNSSNHMTSRCGLDDDEDEELTVMKNLPPKPKKLSEFQNHPVYVLARSVKATQILHPDAKLQGICNGESFYLRCDVHDLYTKVQLYS